MKSEISKKLTEVSDEIETFCRRELDFTNTIYESLLDAMRYSLYSGGKRIRPFLTLQICKLFGGTVETALPFAAAVECVHTYSLIHDDLPCMDNDDFRRGKPTNHKVYGEATALLAGDALLTLAFSFAARNKNADAKKINDAIKLISENAGYLGMIGGQQIDLDGETRKLAYDELLTLHKLKTGKLIECAVLLGCIAAGIDDADERYENARKYADCIGLAYQIEDDVLDMGEEDGKTTFLTFMSPDECKEKVKALTDEAKSALSKYEGSETLCDFADYLAARKF